MKGLGHPMSEIRLAAKGISTSWRHRKRFTSLRARQVLWIIWFVAILVGCSGNQRYADEHDPQKQPEPSDQERQYLEKRAAYIEQQAQEDAKRRQEANSAFDQQLAGQRAKQEAVRAEQQRKAQEKRDEQQRANEALRVAREEQRAKREKEKADQETARLEAEQTAALVAQERGPAYARTSGTKWEAIKRKNPLTDNVEVKVRSRQVNGEGVVAAVEGYCAKGDIVFTAVIVDSLGQPSIKFAYGVGSAVLAQIRVNEEQPVQAALVPLEFVNKVEVARLTNSQLIQDFKRQGYVIDFTKVQIVETTWRVLTQFETTRGTVLVKIPIYNEKIQQLAKSCGTATR